MTNGARETLEASGHFYQENNYMKEYKTNEELINFLKQKNIIFKNENKALNILNKYGYYSIINSYKQIFKNSDGSFNLVIINVTRFF